MRKIFLLVTLVLLVSFVLAVDTNSDTNSDITCTTEGNSMPVYPGYECCDGLSPISPQTDSEPIVGASICSNCGNGTCEAWENQYNCDDDCEETNTDCTDIYSPVCGEITTCSTSTCTASTDGNNETVTCNPGVCSTTKETYSNKCIADRKGATVLYNGECGADQIVTESVKCVFDNTNQAQRCYLVGEENSTCSISAGGEACTVTVKAKEGKSLTWKSSCGGYAYTYMDGINEYAKFKCDDDYEDTVVKESVKCVLWNASGGESCYSEKGDCTVSIYDKASNTQHGTCAIDVSGRKGETITWKSSCGGYAYTILDGDNEYAEFKCGTQIEETCVCTMDYTPVCGRNGRTYGNTCQAECEKQSIAYRGECNAVGNDGYKKAKWMCSNEEDFTKESNTCESYSYWKQMAKDSCNEFSVTTCAIDSNYVNTDSNNYRQGNTNSNQPNITTNSAVSTCTTSLVSVIDFEVSDKCEVSCETTTTNDGCTTQTCSDGTITESCEARACQSQNIDQIRTAKEKCYAESGKVVIEIDSTGCNHYVCVNENAVCKKEISSEKVLSCKENGGEIISRTDEEGCITLFECTKPMDSNASINTEILNDSTKLLELALKLEGLRIELDKTAKKLGAIAEYYNEGSDKNSANKFEAAKQLLLTAVTKVDSLKEFIKTNVDNFSEEDAIQVRATISEIRNGILRDVLMTIL